MNSVCWHFALTIYAVFRRILQYSTEFHLISLNSTVLVYRIIVQVQQTLHNLVNQYTSVESCVYRFQLLSWCSVPFFGRIRPKSAEFGRIRPEIGRNRPNSAEFVKKCIPILLSFSMIYTKYDDLYQNFM